MSFSPEKTYWRFQTGRMRHLGRNTDGVVSYQKSSISGEGRLIPIWFALVVSISTRRLIAEVYSEEPSEAVLMEFWSQVVGDAGGPLVGAAASAVVVSRTTVSSFPGLLSSMAASNVSPVTASVSFKAEIHAASYFEDHLQGLMRHSLFREFSRWSELMPLIVNTYSDLISAKEGTEGYWDAFSAAHHLVEQALGEDPAEVAREVFKSKKLIVTNSSVVPRGRSGLSFSTKYQHTPYESLGYNWEFDFNGRRWSAPLHSYLATAGSTTEVRSSPRLESFVVPEPSLPSELISNIDQVRARPNGGISLDHAALGLSARGWGLRDHYDWLVALMRAWWSTSSSGLPSAAASAPTGSPFDGPYRRYDVSGLHPDILSLGFRRTHGENTIYAYRGAPSAGWQKDGAGATRWFTLIGWTDPEQEAARRLFGRFALPELPSVGCINVTWSAENIPTASLVDQRLDPFMRVEAGPSMGLILCKSQGIPLLTDVFLKELTCDRPRVEAEWAEEERRRQQRAARRAAAKLARAEARQSAPATTKQN